MAAVPSPERYEERTVEGVQYYYDKFDNLLYPKEELLKEIANQSPGLPFYRVPKRIDDPFGYAKERIASIEDFLLGKDSKYEFKDKSEEFLSGLSVNELKFVVLCIDLVGSTKLSQSLSAEDYSKIVQLFSREMAAVVSGFGGFVLKYVGDGLVAYFPEPNFIGMNDNTLDCAYAMKVVLEEAVNPVLAEGVKPILHFRIGIDSGESSVVTVGDISAKGAVA